MGEGRDIAHNMRLIRVVRVVARRATGCREASNETARNK